ncbi:MAG: ATP-binding protein [Candidatus Babeliaceae bacterium]
MKKIITIFLLLTLCVPRVTKTIGALSTLENFIASHKETISLGISLTMLTLSGMVAYKTLWKPEVKIKTRVIKPLESDRTFESLNRTIPQEIKDLLDNFKNPLLYTDTTGNKLLPENCLLYGEPGTGKTELVRALAGEGVPVFYKPFVELSNEKVGRTEEYLRELYKAAENHAIKNKLPFCVVALDEIDVYGLSRDHFSGSDGHHYDTLTQLLTLLDGAIKQRYVVTIGITNRLPRQLDPALIRSGRLGNHIKIKAASSSDNVKILEERLKAKGLKRTQSAIDLLEQFKNETPERGLGKRITSMTAADINSFCNRLHLRTIASRSETISSSIMGEVLSQYDKGFKDPE